MNRGEKMNLTAFVILVVLGVSFYYPLTWITGSLEKPWHLQPSVHEDSLSQGYLDNYQILNHNSLLSQVFDSLRTNVFILIDAWGVPIRESIIKENFGYFESIPHTFALHQRLANRNKHAEEIEFQNSVSNSIYLFGGDSLEYNRNLYIKKIGFEKALFCNKCTDELMISKIDSLLANNSSKFIAWTTQSSRSGDNDSLRKSLKRIADFAERHPDIQIVVQGTHRPVLCDAKVRNTYKSHWVPVMILNGMNE
jgi:hypothetical protein